MTLKQDVVEYLIQQIGNKVKEHYSVLKFIKLLFFVSSVDTRYEKEDILLDNYFSFTAMGYGHIEKEVMSMFRENKLEHFDIKSRQEIVQVKPLDINIPPELKKEINRKINLLEEINPNFFTKYSSFDLVDISQHYYSWQYAWKKAEDNKKHSYPISNTIIKNEEKLYML